MKVAIAIGVAMLTAACASTGEIDGHGGDRWAPHTVHCRAAG